MIDQQCVSLVCTNEIKPKFPPKVQAINMILQVVRD